MIAHLASDALDAWDLGHRSVKLVLHELVDRFLAVRDADVANVVVACRRVERRLVSQLLGRHGVQLLWRKLCFDRADDLLLDQLVQQQRLIA